MLKPNQGSQNEATYLKNSISLITKFCKKPLSEQFFYIEIILWLGISRMVILTLPFKWIAPVFGKHMKTTNETSSKRARQKSIRVARAIRTLSEHMPWECKCLVQAMTGKIMLRNRNVPTTLYLGVSKKEDGDLIAHAWLRMGQFVILGGGGLERFAVVSTFA